jgi:hypothetical protein
MARSSSPDIRGEQVEVAYRVVSYATVGAGADAARVVVVCGRAGHPLNSRRTSSPRFWRLLQAVDRIQLYIFRIRVLHRYPRAPHAAIVNYPAAA